MPDDFSFSYSFQTGPAGARGEAVDAVDRELFAFAGCDLISLGDGSTLLLDSRGGRQMAVSPEGATPLTRPRQPPRRGTHAEMTALLRRYATKAKRWRALESFAAIVTMIYKNHRISRF